MSNLNTVKKAQSQWAKYIKEIGKTWESNGDFRKVAETMMNDLYYFENTQDPHSFPDPSNPPTPITAAILFNPTVSNEIRINKLETMYYFIGGGAFEDGGFALKNWKDKNWITWGESYYLPHVGNQTLVMGTYSFHYNKSGESENICDVFYTFGYKEIAGELRIVLHHSSVPYSK